MGAVTLPRRVVCRDRFPEAADAGAWQGIGQQTEQLRVPGAAFGVRAGVAFGVGAAFVARAAFVAGVVLVAGAGAGLIGASRMAECSATAGSACVVPFRGPDAVDRRPGAVDRRPGTVGRSAVQTCSAARARTLSAVSRIWPIPAKTARSTTTGASLMRSLTCGIGIVVLLACVPASPLAVVGASVCLSSLSRLVPFTAPAAQEFVRIKPGRHHPGGGRQGPRRAPLP